MTGVELRTSGIRSDRSDTEPQPPPCASIIRHVLLLMEFLDSTILNNRMVLRLA